jgi:hypothetical protein
MLTDTILDASVLTENRHAQQSEVIHKASTIVEFVLDTHNVDRCGNLLSPEPPASGTNLDGVSALP